MKAPTWITELLNSIDEMNPTKNAEYITDDAIFALANIPPIVGKTNITAFLDGFYKSIKGLKHELNNYIAGGDYIVTTGMVTYTRHSGSELTVKFCNVFQMEGSLIKHYDVYVDSSALYNE